MPEWMQLVVGIAAVVTAAGVIWTKVLRPGAKLISNTEEMLPLIRSLTITFRDVPHAFAVLEEIVAQFRTNSGSSLRDAINRLEEAAIANRAAGEVLKVQVEVVKELASADRRQLERLITLLNYLDAKVTIGTDTVKRMEESAAGVAHDLDIAHQRADLIEPGAPPGTAADAAAKTAEESAAAIERRRAPMPVEEERREHPWSYPI